MSATRVDHTPVVREGQRIIIPEGLSYEAAIEAIRRQATAEEQEVEICERIQGFVPDVAVALARALEETFGWTDLQGRGDGFFTSPPTIINVKCGPGDGDVVAVPWGTMRVAAMPGTTFNIDAAIGGCTITVTTRRKHEARIRDLIRTVRRILRERSIYRGQAFRITLTRPHGERLPFPEPQFLRLDGPEPTLILPRDIEAAVQDNIWTPIQMREACRAQGVPPKRGVILAGTYGTGKTLTAHVTARRAVQHGWTFILLDKASDLPHGIELALQYQPAVLFAEDVDRATNGDRDAALDTILNTVDGIEKGGEILLVLTTNNVESIHKAMLRPGRIDCVIPFTPPDAEAAARLCRAYTGTLLAPEEDLTPVGSILAGRIPAVIREACERAKLSMLSRTATAAGKNGRMRLTAEDLVRAARTMELQLRLLDGEAPATPSPFEAFGREMQAISEKVRAIASVTGAGT